MPLIKFSLEVSPQRIHVAILIPVLMAQPPLSGPRKCAAPPATTTSTPFTTTVEPLPDNVRPLLRVAGMR